MDARIGIVGAGGRMGRAIAAAATQAGATVAGGIGRDGGSADLAALAAASSVLIDFSTPAALPATLAAAVAAGTPLVIGTTGLQPADHLAIDRAAADIAVLQSANTALGVNLLRRLVAEAARRLGPDWDVEVLEMHHRHKVDAPSGTALMLGAAAAEGRGRPLDALVRHDRAGVREPGTIGFASLRGGSVAGDHLVVLAGDGERIELAHRAESRAIFAAGAMKAALWLTGRAPGRYTMDDVLGL